MLVPPACRNVFPSPYFSIGYRWPRRVPRGPYPFCTKVSPEIRRVLVLALLLDFFISLDWKCFRRSRSPGFVSTFSGISVRTSVVDFPLTVFPFYSFAVRSGGFALRRLGGPSFSCGIACSSFLSPRLDFGPFLLWPFLTLGNGIVTQALSRTPLPSAGPLPLLLFRPAPLSSRRQW